MGKCMSIFRKNKNGKSKATELVENIDDVVETGEKVVEGIQNGEKVNDIIDDSLEVIKEGTEVISDVVDIVDIVTEEPKEEPKK